jgi:oligoribonuclease
VKAGRLVWVDLETTGLYPGPNHILEIAVVVTDDQLRELGSMEAVIHRDPSDLDMEPVVAEMHAANGLLTDVTDPAWAHCQGRKSVDLAMAKAVALVEDHCELGQAHLAGNSIALDKDFIRETTDWRGTHLLSHLHYRILDVSCFKVAAQLWAPSTEPDKDRLTGGKKNHRAMADLRASIAEMAHYVSHLMEWGNLNGAGMNVGALGNQGTLWPGGGK